MKKSSMTNPVESLGHIATSATVWIASDLLKALVILSDATVLRSAGNREGLNHTGNQKKGHISRSDQQSYFASFSNQFTSFWKNLVTTERRSTVFAQ